MTSNGKKKIVVFGGANAPDPYSAIGYEIGKSLAQEGYITITGGGPGMMREINKGANDHGGESWGICIEHRAEEIVLDYFTYHEIHHRFDERNDRLLSMGDAFIVLPGGLGTIVEALQITQRKKFEEIDPNTPLLFVGDFYKRLASVFDEMNAQGFITDNLSDLYKFVDTTDEMLETLRHFFQ
ncbi:MAG: LOG family protein [Patescibacteria group bacterium]|nr:LOG family protein [Patescibacteria group bacterium]